MDPMTGSWQNIQMPEFFYGLLKLAEVMKMKCVRLRLIPPVMYTHPEPLKEQPISILQQQLLTLRQTEV
jgi:hypothetical protein